MTYRYSIFLCMYDLSWHGWVFAASSGINNSVVHQQIIFCSFLSCCTGEIVFSLFPSTERLNCRMSYLNAGAGGDLFLLRFFSSTTAGHKKSLKPVVLGWSEVSLSITTPVYPKESAWNKAKAFGFQPLWMMLSALMLFRKPTDEVPPGLVLISLLPVAWPGDQHSVMFQASEPTGLEQVGGGITHVRRHSHLTEALYLLSLHQFMQCLKGMTERITVTKRERCWKLAQC